MVKMKVSIGFVFIIFQFINISCSKLDITRLPKIGADSVITVQANSVIAKARIIDAGRGFETYGHCWSKTQNPTISDFNTNFGAVNEAILFESHITNLEPNTKYFLRHFFFDGQNYQYGPESYFITSLAESASGNTLEISDIKPINDAIEVPLDETIVIKFNKPLDTNTINEYNIYLREGTSTVKSNIAYVASSFEIEITPDTILKPATQYDIVVTEYIRGTDDSNMDLQTYSFTTTSKTMLDIEYILPGNNSIDVSLEDSIIITFNNALTASTINEYNIYLFDGTSKVSSTLIYDDVQYKLTIIPNANLLPNTLYEIVVTDGLKAFDNSYLVTRTFYFTTINSIFLNDGLIAYYTFDNNAFDYSGNANHCIEYSNEVYVQGVKGMAHDFNGSSDYLQLTNTLDASNGLSFSFWVFVEEAVSGEKTGTIISKYNMGTDQHCFFVSAFNAWNDPVSYRLSNQFYNSITNKDYVLSNWQNYDSIPESFNREKYTILNPQTLLKNEWVHCVNNITETEIQIWINGQLTVLKEREFQTYFFSNIEPTYIGNNLVSGDGDNNHFHGVLDEFRIYNRGLTEDEIQTLYLQ